ncbi:uncharacterized protein LOC129766239 [Toxorhynchites rutilus septentrionalis]|uniref:uncharacterized protein LOC129766239 n=1 Tax=Toxorhynchites rutilus septentrionalis TaxID=329112 RepID=UPI00247B0182|nr:uncharacterized protein LOC129766239 [Toxorhynchites rutilus septentrionalis]
MEDPYPSGTVALHHNLNHQLSSRPGPMFSSGDGVFQLALSGKYPPITSTRYAEKPSYYSFITSGSPQHHNESSAQQTSSPGRYETGFMEAPNPPATVEILQPSLSSRPGPVSGVREGVFHHAVLGKYDSVFSSSDSHPSTGSSDATNVWLPPQPVAAPVDCVWLYYQNVRGVRTKIDDLLLAVTDCNYDVIILTETGLNDCIDSLQIFGSTFNVFRCDRSCINSNKTSFGGVLIAVHHRYSCTQIHTPHGEILEQVFAVIVIGNKRLAIGAVYIPPDRSRDVELIDEHVASVRDLCDNAICVDQVLLCGDYNQPRLQWLQSAGGEVLPAGASTVSASSAALIDGMDFLNLSQVNWHRNQLDRTLDLVFCSNGCNVIVNTAVVALLPVDTHHPQLEISLPVPRTCQYSDVYPVADEYTPDFGKIDYDALGYYLPTLDWTYLNACQNVNEMASDFCFTIQRWLRENVPHRRRPVSPSWSTALLRQLKREKNACQRKHRVLQSSDSKLRFQHATSEAQVKFAFLGVPSDVISLTTFVVTPAMVISAAKKLKSSLSPGPDGIPSVLFCRCAADLAEPLSVIFTRSLNDGVFPEIWKESFMFPVFKNGNKRNVRNYRGITSLSAASKLFEIIVSEVILTQSKRYISTDQHGFMPGRSVTTNLLNFTNTCITAMEGKAQVDVIYTDLKAAFDRIDHNILLAKLSRLGSSAKLVSCPEAISAVKKAFASDNPGNPLKQ